MELAFGFRTPYLRSETTFYRDYVQLPVRLKLNFAPAQLLSHIEVRAALDFVNLEKWRFWVPDLPFQVRVGKTGAAELERLSAIETGVLALEGGDATIALVLRLGPTLESVSKGLYYSESSAADGPESHAGQRPGVGYSLTDWRGVDAGNHWFVAESFVLPAGYDLGSFAQELDASPLVVAGPLQTGGSLSLRRTTGPSDRRRGAARE